MDVQRIPERGVQQMPGIPRNRLCASTPAGDIMKADQAFAIINNTVPTMLVRILIAA